MVKFRLLDLLWEDLAGKIVSALKRADEIERAGERELDTIILNAVELSEEPGPLGRGRARSGPTVILLRSGKRRKRRAVIFLEGDGQGFGFQPWGLDREAWEDN